MIQLRQAYSKVYYVLKNCSRSVSTSWPKIQWLPSFTTIQSCWRNTWKRRTSSDSWSWSGTIDRESKCSNLIPMGGKNKHRLTKLDVEDSINIGPTKMNEKWQLLIRNAMCFTHIWNFEKLRWIQWVVVSCLREKYKISKIRILSRFLDYLADLCVCRGEANKKIQVLYLEMTKQ